MLLLRRHPVNVLGSILITHEEAAGSTPVALIRGPHGPEIARLFVQSPCADQLVREAVAIISNADELDIRDWLRAARAYLETIDDCPEDPS